MLQLNIRHAGPNDAEIIHAFIVELAIFEREPDAVVATIAGLRAQMTSKSPPFECLIAELRADREAEPEPAGFALFFHNYSTWRGRQGLYLEDLYVPLRHRQRGIGHALLARVAALAVARGCARFEWVVLDWNTAAKDFYNRLGAFPLDDWTLFRLEGDALKRLALAAADVALPRW